MPLPQPLPYYHPAGCKSGRTNKHCTNNMCQKHCFKTGNCAYSRHHAGDSSTSISIPASGPLPPHAASSSRVPMFPRSASSSSLTPVSSNTPFPAHIPVFPGARPFRSFDDLASTSLICDTNRTWIVLVVDAQAAGVVIKMEGLNIIGGINCVW
ncbi:hypothetical protein B0H14DRAFT_3463997 [Mycena olivaceomarginata]|nr:hypothetical protein B0H14DRAFT_3463997 [Mycena olivaceomarginata]